MTCFGTVSLNGIGNAEPAKKVMLLMKLLLYIATSAASS